MIIFCLCKAYSKLKVNKNEYITKLCGVAIRTSHVKGNEAIIGKYLDVTKLSIYPFR